MTYPNNFFELDFLAVETAKSGDAITMRSAIDGIQYINVIDGGFTDMGEKIVEHLEKYYTNQPYIDNVVLTHPDGDHARGLKYVLENKTVRALWMNRPWLYADQIIDRFSNFTNVNNLRTKLRECYPNVAALEDIALEREIPIFEAFQGETIGHFRVLSPSYNRYLDLIVDSDKTPSAKVTTARALTKALESLQFVINAASNLLQAAWGEEIFSSSGTSCENEMSLIQYAEIGGLKILLTGDAGREALAEAVDYAPSVGIALPGIHRFQVPHHGSRRNVSTELLDQILGPRLDYHLGAGNEIFTALISSAEADLDHPRKAVERAMHHRGGCVIATEGSNKSTGWNAPDRAGWSVVPSRPYPNEQEE